MVASSLKYASRMFFVLASFVLSAQESSAQAPKTYCSNYRMNYVSADLDYHIQLADRLAAVSIKTTVFEEACAIEVGGTFKFFGKFANNSCEFDLDPNTICRSKIDDEILCFDKRTRQLIVTFSAEESGNGDQFDVLSTYCDFYSHNN